jgi:hypothetical protein
VGGYPPASLTRPLFRELIRERFPQCVASAMGRPVNPASQQGTENALCLLFSVPANATNPGLGEWAMSV